MKIANYKRCLPQALAALLLIGGGATQAFAQTTTVNVTGNITGQCTMTGGASLSIGLGNVAASNFTAAGTVYPSVPTSSPDFIVLTCTANPGIRMTLSTGAIAGQPNTVLPLTATSTATGIGVQLFQTSATGTGTPAAFTATTAAMASGSAITIPTGGTVRVRIGAKYYATSATPSAGSANSTATLTFAIN